MRVSKTLYDAIITKQPQCTSSASFISRQTKNCIANYRYTLDSKSNYVSVAMIFVAIRSAYFILFITHTMRYSISDIVLFTRTNEE